MADELWPAEPTGSDGGFMTVLDDGSDTLQGAPPQVATAPSVRSMREQARKSAADTRTGPILLVENYLGDAHLVERMLKRARPEEKLQITHVGNVDDAIACLVDRYFSVVIVDSALLDSSGPQIVTRLTETGNGAAIVVIGAVDDSALAARAFHAGAQDYLVKSQLTGYGLVRSIRYAVERRRAQAQLTQLAQFDQLTGVLNRTAFRHRLVAALEDASRDLKPFALLHLDLDRFKPINATLGDDIGDKLLRATASRLRRTSGSNAFVARLGPDEFAIGAVDLTDPEEAALLAEGVGATLSAPFSIGGEELFVTASIGIAVYPFDGDAPNQLAKRAESAMYRARERGGNTHAFYSAEMNIAEGDRFRLESGLRRALSRREFVLHYQPKVDPTSGQAIGLEALIRWRHPTEGLIAPVRFVPLLEETGQIVEVGAWAMRQVCDQIRQWQSDGTCLLPVAVNVSARQLAEPRFVDDVARIIGESGIAPDHLEIEITESLLIEDPEASRGTLLRLNQLGVHLSIDDFGVGYSSLNYLANFPVHTLKIDQSFVHDLPADPNKAVLVAGIIALAQSLGLTVVAEGVETQTQLKMLREFGVDAIQGYLHSRPLPPDALARWLNDPDSWTEQTV